MGAALNATGADTDTRIRLRRIRWIRMYGYAIERRGRPAGPLVASRSAPLLWVADSLPPPQGPAMRPPRSPARCPSLLFDIRLFTSYPHCSTVRTVIEHVRVRTRAAGRPMVYSICSWGGGAPQTWGPTVGHSWRTGAGRIIRTMSTRFDTT